MSSRGRVVLVLRDRFVDFSRVVCAGCLPLFVRLVVVPLLRGVVDVGGGRSSADVMDDVVMVPCRRSLLVTLPLAVVRLLAACEVAACSVLVPPSSPLDVGEAKALLLELSRAVDVEELLCFFVDGDGARMTGTPAAHDEGASIQHCSLPLLLLRGVVSVVFFVAAS